MANVSDTIPESLQAEAEAALSWYNATQTEQFEVTGIVDADLSLSANEPRTLRLVLCGGDICQQQSFRVSTAEKGFNISLAQATATSQQPTEIQSELDPPPGALRGWLDSVLDRHRFVVLVFYRGFW